MALQLSARLATTLQQHEPISPMGGMIALELPKISCGNRESWILDWGWLRS
jgi:hypothetical protein